jgi:two-component system, response regulator, stage 0 sporulation protein F
VPTLFSRTTACRDISGYRKSVKKVQLHVRLSDHRQKCCAAKKPSGKDERLITNWDRLDKRLAYVKLKSNNGLPTENEVGKQSAKRILLVDDEENARIGLSRLLSNEGFVVDSVSNGFEALSYLRQQDVDLIISDVNMPEMNGISFLKELNKSFPKSNVIMITAYGGVESYIEAMNLGAFEYVNKPIKIEEIKSILKKIFKDN